MALPEGLSEKGRSFWAFLDAAQGTGLSARRTIQIMRRHGMGYRYSTFLRDWRIIAAWRSRGEIMARVPRGVRLSEEYYLQAEGFTRREYSTLVRVQVQNVESGEIEDKYFWVGHDELMTPARLQEIVENTIARDSEDRYGYFVVDVTPIRGVRRPRLI